MYLRLKSVSFFTPLAFSVNGVIERKACKICRGIAEGMVEKRNDLYSITIACIGREASFMVEKRNDLHSINNSRIRREASF